MSERVYRLGRGPWQHTRLLDCPAEVLPTKIYGSLVCFLSPVLVYWTRTLIICLFWLLDLRGT